MSSESKKNAHLKSHLGAFFDSMSLPGCQINLIYVNFHFQKNLEIFDKKSAAKNLIQKEQGWVESALPHANYG